MQDLTQKQFGPVVSRVFEKFLRGESCTKKQVGMIINERPGKTIRLCLGNKISKTPQKVPLFPFFARSGK